MMAKTRVHIAMIGYGGVAKAFLEQLTRLQGLRAHQQDIRLVYLSTSTRCLLTADYSPIAFSGLDQHMHQLSSSETKPLHAEDLLLYLRTGGAPAVIIDNTSSPQIAASYPRHLREGISIITPNKKAFSSSLAEWEDIFNTAYPTNPHGGRVLHEATVGAGLPVICTIKDLLATGDTITRIEGIFSGTMSYLFNSFSPVADPSTARDAVPWSEAVRTAQKLGYTEPDPRDDLNGMDVARKCTILARLLGLRTGVPAHGGFPVQSLIPEQLTSCRDGPEFLARLPEFDSEMQATREKAEASKMVARYVGCVDVLADSGMGSISVGVRNFEPSHPIAALKGSDNIFNIYTERYGPSPLIVQGAGAGSEVTAMGVTADLIRLLDTLPP